MSTKLNFKIPEESFLRNEDYVLSGKVTSFVNSKGIVLKHSSRNAYLSILEEYANTTIENYTETLEWIEKVIKEGKKQFRINKVYDNNQSITFRNLKNSSTCESTLLEIFDNFEKSSIIDPFFETKLTLTNFNIENNIENSELVDSISFTFKILLREIKSEDVKYTIIYPIYVDLDMATMTVVARSKAKSNIYKIIGDVNSETRSTTKPEKLLKSAIDYLLPKLGLEYSTGIRDGASEYKKAFYSFLQNFVETPQPIMALLNSKKIEITQIKNDILRSLNIDSDTYSEKIERDITNLYEKYISISWNNPNDFIADRIAYPIKLKATDSENTKFEESCDEDTPLQRTEKYYDNKNSMDKDETCDGMILSWKKSLSEERFKIVFIINEGSIYIKFLTGYVDEEDIQNVLSTFKEHL